MEDKPSQKAKTFKNNVIVGLPGSGKTNEQKLTPTTTHVSPCAKNNIIPVAATKKHPEVSRMSDLEYLEQLDSGFDPEDESEELYNKPPVNETRDEWKKRREQIIQRRLKQQQQLEAFYRSNRLGGVFQQD